MMASNHRVRGFLVGVAFMLFAMAAVQAAEAWTASWTASPHRPVQFGPGPAMAPFENQTIRQVVRLGAGGRQLRIRFSNEFGSDSLRIGAASVALPAKGGAVNAASLRRLTFGGATSIVVRAGAPVLSDAIDLPVAAAQELAITVYLPARTEPATMHMTGLQTTYISAAGDFSQAAEMPVASSNPMRFFLSGVEVSGGPARSVIVAFGDSITDGAGSTVDANRRWPDLFADRLRSAGRKWQDTVVVNQGISGNRVLSDGMGVSALARFDRDVLSVPGVTHVVVLEGINDIGMIGLQIGPAPANPADVPTAEDIIGGYRQLIARAHAHGLKIIGATLLPFEGAATGYYTPEKEPIRQAVNQWIRTAKAFDGVIDFDAATRDPQQPGRLQAAYDSGDHLHPSDAGYQAMADAVNLALFD